jgi:VWFA-related protein
LPNSSPRLRVTSHGVASRGVASCGLASCGLALALVFAATDPQAASPADGVASQTGRSSQTGPSSQTATPRQRSLYASVVDRSGAPVAGVTPEDLVVREDGVAREILRVEPAAEPMQLALLIDNSEAANSAIQFLRDSLGPFVDTLTSKGHRVSLVTLADRPTLVVNATSDSAELRKKGIDRLFAQPGAGAYLLDALVETSRGFAKNEAPRPVIVAVITEGIEFSNDSYELVLDTLKKGGVSFYALVLTEGQEADPKNDEVRNRNIVLDRGTRETGGHRETVISNQALAGALKKLATELVNLHKVTYASPDRLIPPEKFAIEAKRRGLTARGVPVRTPPR